MAHLLVNHITSQLSHNYSTSFPQAVLWKLLLLWKCVQRTIKTHSWSEYCLSKHLGFCLNIYFSNAYLYFVYFDQFCFLIFCLCLLLPIWYSDSHLTKIWSVGPQTLWGPIGVWNTTIEAISKTIPKGGETISTISISKVPRFSISIRVSISTPLAPAPPAGGLKPQPLHAGPVTRVEHVWSSCWVAVGTKACETIDIAFCTHVQRG